MMYNKRETIAFYQIVYTGIVYYKYNIRIGNREDISQVHMGLLCPAVFNVVLRTLQAGQRRLARVLLSLQCIWTFPMRVSRRRHGTRSMLSQDTVKWFSKGSLSKFLKHFRFDANQVAIAWKLFCLDALVRRLCVYTFRNRSVLQIYSCSHGIVFHSGFWYTQQKRKLVSELVSQGSRVFACSKRCDTRYQESNFKYLTSYSCMCMNN